MADNSINFMALMNPEFAARQQSLARQQMLAQQIMEQGNAPEDINKLANPGGLVTPYSPMHGLAKAGEKIAGAYMQKQVDDQQLDAYKQFSQQMNPSQSDVMGSATNAAIGQEGGMGPATAPDVASQYGPRLAAAMSAGSTSNQPTLQEQMIGQMNEKLGAAMYENRMKLQNAGPIKAAENAVTPVNQNGHMAYMTPPSSSVAANLPLPPALQQGIANQTNVAQPAIPTSNAPHGNPNITTQSPDGAAAINDLFGDQSKPPTPAKPVNINSSTGQNVDWNDPAAAKGAVIKAEKDAENSAMADKGVVGIDSRINNVFKTLNEMADLSPQKGHGTFGEYVGVPLSRNIGKGDEATAQTKFEQKNANLFTQELGPLLQSIQGTKGSIPLINAIKEASQIPEYGSKKEERGAIEGLKEQLKIYQENMHNAQGMQGKATSIPATPDVLPSPQEIVDALRGRGHQIK